MHCRYTYQIYHHYRYSTLLCSDSQKNNWHINIDEFSSCSLSPITSAPLPPCGRPCAARLFPLTLPQRRRRDGGHQLDAGLEESQRQHATGTAAQRRHAAWANVIQHGWKIHVVRWCSQLDTYAKISWLRISLPATFYSGSVYRNSIVWT